MLSIITAIYNHLPMNQIYLETLRKFTDQPFELIIIDNGSNDGSLEFFKQAGSDVIVIENGANFPYGVCQNQGIKAAKFDVLCFFNNDIIVSPHWDTRILSVMDTHDLEVITPCGVERMQSKNATLFYKKKWLYLKKICELFGYSRSSLLRMHRVMYGNWNRFCENRFKKFGCDIGSGMVGHSVILKRTALQKIGEWDEKIWAADHDIYARTMQRHLEKGDIKPIHTALGVFHHHYIRLTCGEKTRPVQPARFEQMSMLQKWGSAAITKLTAGMKEYSITDKQR